MVSIDFHMKDHETRVQTFETDEDKFVTLKISKYPEELTIYFENLEQLTGWLLQIVKQITEHLEKELKE